MKSPDDDQNYVRIVHNSISLTNDGGNSFRNAITPRGIIGEQIFGQIIAGGELAITNESGSVVIDDNGFNVTDMSLSLTRSGSRSRILLNAFDGLKIQENTGSTGSPVWTDRLSADTDGNLRLTGALATGTGASSVRADTNGLYIGNSTFANAPVRITPSGNATFAGTITASNVSLTGGSIGWGNFSVSPSGVITASGANISGNITMTGGTISWANVNTDPVATGAASTAIVALSVAAAIANGTYSGGTFISGSQIYSPSILGGTIQIGTGNSIFKPDMNGIYLGHASFASATFRVTPSGAVTANNISITGGSITGALNVDIANNITIHNQVRLNPNNLLNGIRWGTSPGIEIYWAADTSSLWITAQGALRLSATGAVYANGEIVATRNWVQSNVVARFA